MGQEDQFQKIRILICSLCTTQLLLLRLTMLLAHRMPINQLMELKKTDSLKRGKTKANRDTMEQLLTLMLQSDLNIPSMPITRTLSFLLQANLVRISIIMEGLLTLRLRIVKQTNKCIKRNRINLTRT